MIDTLDALDRRIVGALQIDGRASWHRIADALGESEHTVAPRGERLLGSGIVRVTGLPAPAAGTIVGIRCRPGQQRLVALALARRRDTRYAHVLAGPVGCIAEIDCPPQRLAGLVVDELPALPGLVESVTWTVLRYVRTAHQWRPGLLGPEERDALTEHLPLPEQVPFGETKGRNRADQMLLAALQRDARRDFAELARVTGLSEAAVRRRVERLRREGRLLIRAIVDPVRLGFAVRAIVWARAAPRDVEAVAGALCREPWVRYASCISGEHQLMAEVALPSVDALHDFLTTAPWLAGVAALDSALIAATLKRGGLFVPPDEH
ncbi:Lrp/AsnC family transcriptional regulator [Pseudonocardia bannensis]|uniref:Lrp/AsnC family transcriptional regulator n=1 Tax=Pseudonocardia bannensis TaxID=630973 RepID=A0A848DD33_9PSEU|nr:Lrp/AsnC family transcriptional regulator [Pseudonocardia bannensis]NMH90511.1 Lrp/AsnC family transcriptional regulator [Pseudonocardia bannensis]